MSPDQKTTTFGIALVVAVAIICITGLVGFAVSCGHDGSIVSLGVAAIAALAAGLSGFKIRDVIGK